MNGLDTLVDQLRGLPGVGKRAAGKMALHLLLNREQALYPMLHALRNADATIKTCSTCGNLDASDPCSLCTDTRRDAGLLCVVPGVSDLWALERTRLYRGRYHVIGGLLSAINGITPQHLRLHTLADIAAGETLREVILALPTSVEGASTAHHVMEFMKPLCRPDVAFTRLAQGLPMGGHLETMDEGTLSIALSGRRSA